jgi:hypothetical protein
VKPNVTIALYRHREERVMIKAREIPLAAASGNKEKSAEKACRADSVRTGCAGGGEG